ncbi:tyrosine-type recombinase/integrase [Variovorax sp. J22R133]|uniref:tyrosine-type recombinase/integrase n=1 Tax=Variovorax brevis TaxID=3053503 RepID=UPI0025777186|nr:tyrosine-type recombinase/integrase [Variovorax sp. J22R133]MDM0118001.1 tyrosine-type recombinase/integrase [Variovorax sp. J22R133]
MPTFEQFVHAHCSLFAIDTPSIQKPVAYRRRHLHQSPHIFRHSLATELLRASATLSEIGHLLRHKSHDTTRIYAKVDIEALRTLSLPWPGGVLDGSTLDTAAVPEHAQGLWIQVSASDTTARRLRLLHGQVQGHDHHHEARDGVGHVTCRSACVLGIAADG